MKLGDEQRRITPWSEHSLDMSEKFLKHKRRNGGGFHNDLPCGKDSLN
jgi:hypothetical protein